MSSNERFCAMVLIKLEDKYLGVSRKDDHNDIGMPGGKCDPNESYADCAIRETLEETGYTIRLLDVPYYKAPGLNCDCITYLAEIVPVAKKPIADTETGIVGAFDKEDFLNGFSGEYNEHMFKYFGL